MSWESGNIDQFEHLEITKREQWRNWLSKNYKRDQAVWLVTYKKYCGYSYVDYDTVVCEALCFGWVDSHTRRVDEDRTKLLFSPRREKSPWSATNKKRVKTLINEKRMEAAGMAKIKQAKKDGSGSIYDDIEKGIEPDDLKAALDSKPQARKHWNDFKKKVRKNILWWIKSARKEETRENRINKTVEMAVSRLMANHPY